MGNNQRLHDYTDDTTRSGLTLITCSTSIPTPKIISITPLHCYLSEWFKCIHGQRANSGLSHNNMYRVILRCQWMSQKQHLRWIVNMMYLNRPDAFVPPSWHAVLPDCCMTNRQNRNKSCGPQRDSVLVSELYLVDGTDHTMHGFT